MSNLLFEGEDNEVVDSNKRLVRNHRTMRISSFRVKNKLKGSPHKLFFKIKQYLIGIYRIAILNHNITKLIPDFLYI